MSPNTKSLRFYSDSGEESPQRREDNGFFFETNNNMNIRHRKKQSSINIQPIAEIEVTNLENDKDMKDVKDKDEEKEEDPK